MDFSLFTQIDTIEIADIHLNFNDILQNQNFGIKKLIISKDLCIRLENSNDFNDFMLTSLKVFPTLKIIKFDEIYSPLIFETLAKCMNLENFLPTFEINCLKIVTNQTIYALLKLRKEPSYWKNLFINEI